MYFKKLEVIGFKSFAEKTKLHFEPGVTAIVGPNGCGKSNISDAIKWAFGEQAPKSLRASRMEDVIFNGTDNRDPINMAEVSITFSNESKVLPIEYEEVTFTRRLFRSGESEYLLNKTPVRLKDIQELLMGTGLGTSSYSIIEQGKMDLILSSRPEERRYVFEEASGITRYKSKKKEALNKLQQTENNLLRINDIITEVKRQIGSIERQAKKAERYKQEFEKLKEMDTKFSFFNYKNLKNEEKIVSVEIEDIKNKKSEILSIIARLNEVDEKLKSDVELLSERFSSAQKTLFEATSSIDKDSHKLSVNKERIKELQQLKILLDEEIKSDDQRRISLENSLNELKKRVASFNEEKSAKESVINQKEEAHVAISKEIATHHKDITDSKGQTVENLAERTRLNNETARLSTEIQNNSTRLKRIQMEREKETEEFSSIEAQLSEIASEAKSVEETLSSLDQKRRSHENELEGYKQNLENLKKSLTDQQKQSSLLKSRLQFLEELAKSYEGFDKGARAIIEAKKQGLFQGVEGPICDIVDVKGGFETLFEIALSSDLQSFIVKSRAEARELLSYLEEKNLGTASVIISSELPKASPTKPLERLKLSPMIDVASIKDEYSDVLRHLLKDVYITEDETNIFDNIARLSPGAAVITKEGRLIQRGKIIGGVARRSDDVSIVGREKRIKEVRVLIEETDKKVSELNEAINTETPLVDATENKIKSIAGEFRTEEIKLANINTRKQAVEAQLNRLKEEREVLESEVKELRELLQDLNTRHKNIQNDLKQIEDKQMSCENLIISSQDSVEKKSKQKEELLVELTKYKTELASLSREENSLLESLSREESAFNGVASGVESKRRQIDDGIHRVGELEEENKGLESQSVNNSSMKEELQKEIEKIRDEKALVMEKVNAEDQKIEGHRHSLEQLSNDSHKIEVKKTELSYKQSSLKDKVLQAYKVDLDEMHLPEDELVISEEQQTTIQELKEKLERMGTVNLVAIEEHQELQERFNFLTHQQQDLFNAKESLMKAIQKINKTTRSLFIETFTKIQGEFKNFFRLLFGGGQAELLLLDERDILESGIEIIVRPPGKKLQNISLLSGGEKALTAIALLFAVFKVKPSPFCILDEMDAPLDESNIGRFSNVLRDFVKSSQFIIITHNKKTIELADVMYGITMEQSGISKIVSVKFADAKKEERKTEILT